MASKKPSSAGKPAKSTEQSGRRLGHEGREELSQLGTVELYAKASEYGVEVRDADGNVRENSEIVNELANLVRKGERLVDEGADEDTPTGSTTAVTPST
jgi:hypothetical protein